MTMRATDWIEKFAELVSAELEAQGINTVSNELTSGVVGGVGDDGNDTDTVAFYQNGPCVYNDVEVCSLVCGNTHVYCCIEASYSGGEIRITELELNVIDGLVGSDAQSAQDIVRIFAIAALQSSPVAINLK